jgi:N-methylhydantoinase A
VFSGRGLLSADFKLRSDRTLMWDFDDLDRLADINHEISEFVDGIVADLAADGFDPARFHVERHADLKYSGQVFELSVPMPDVLTEDTVPVLDKEFRRLYEQTYGSGAAWEGVVPTMTTYTVTVTAGSEGHTAEVLLSRSPLTIGEFKSAPRSRSIYLPSEQRMHDVPIYDAAAVAPGQYGIGPLVIDSVDTTIFVPTGVKVERDTFRNWRLSI